MRHRMWIRIGAVALVAGWLVALPGAAQTALPIVVVESGPTQFPDLDESQKFSDLEEAVAAAKTLAADQGRTVSVLVTAGTWPANIEIGSTDDIEIVGVADNVYSGTTVVTDGPARVVVSSRLGGTEDVFELTGAMGTVVIEGLSICSGLNGVKMLNDSQAVVTRCHLWDNAEAGVFCDDTSTPLIINCTIRNNGQDGVHVEGTAEPWIQFCTLYDNANRGVYVMSGADARVGNCLVYSNGSGGGSDGGLVWQASSAYTASFNNVAINNPASNNYVNVTGTDDPGADPLNDPPGDPPLVDANGKLLLKDGLVGKADPNFDAALAGWERFVATDLEGEPRPSMALPYDSGDPDIGSDEYYAGGAVGNWYYVNVIPPDPTAYIESASGTLHPAVGRLEAGELLIELRISGVSPTNVFIVPQGGESTNVNHRIVFSEVASGGSVWYGANAEDIETVVYNQVGGELVPNQGDIIADGHGVVYAMAGASFINPNTDQVRTYRHVLIDTVPPRAVSYPVSAASLAILQNSLGHNGSGRYAAEALGLPSTLHPYAALPSDWRPTDSPLGTPPFFPYDDGLITEVPGTSDGAKAFFNVGSISNNLPVDNVLPPEIPLGTPNAEPLNVSIVVSFEDPPVRDLDTGLRIEGDLTDEDPFTSVATRQTSGFPPSTDGVPDTPDDLPADLLDPAQWRFVDETDLPAGVGVYYDIATGGANSGYDFGNPLAESAPSATVDLDNRGMDASWRFEHEVAGAPVPGIWWHGSDKDYLHLAVKFVAKDRAGNMTYLQEPTIGYSDSTYIALDPFHLWWMFRARTRVLPNLEGQEVVIDKAVFNWKLRRAFDPDPAGRPRPLYTYRIWRSTVAGGPGYNAVYEPVSAWGAWSETGRIGPPEFLALDSSVPGGVLGYWLLLVVAGADEAGNVEPWPWEDLTLDFGGTEQVALTGAAASGSNWQRFYLQSPQNAVDTSVNAVFWHDSPTYGTLGDGDDVRLGSNTVVPMPADATPARYITAAFQVTPTYESTTYPVWIKWQLFAENGAEITAAPPDVPAGPSGQTVALPFVQGGSFPLLPSATNKEVSYVFRAFVFIDDDSIPGYSSDDTADPTPANLQFTLVYESVGEFLGPRDSKDDQPIKVQQRE
ncbi:MAG: right-handed parallel beta-helix repeat-containing protein [Candidatus Hydrogenedentes bacterium]|nr:right-handed parallel beta-helix repeat-containing protein [Candidatus Hydrogenedentota bacterium]